MKLPEGYAEKMKVILGDEAEEYFKCLTEDRVYGLRANTLKISADELRKKLPYLTESVPWCGEGFYYPESERPAKSPYYNAGLFYLQEPSAMSPAAFADIRPGQRVLDVCAAPGGKSTYIAAKLNGSGMLVANDVSASRCKALVKNIELCGAKNATVLNEAPERLAKRFENFFDRILIDAPCSGEGMFRKDPSAASNWDEHKPQACMILQRGILKSCAAMLKSGGKMIYSTCTFEPEENEEMVYEFMESHEDFTVVPVEHPLFDIRRGCARLWPHRLKGEGHFLCVMEKAGGFDAGFTKTGSGKTSTAKSQMEIFRRFCGEVLSDCCHCFSNNEYDYVINGIALYAVSPELPDLSGIRVARSGWYLGDIKADRFEPSQALAMALKRSDAAQSISFEPQDEGLERYLRGESIDIETKDGWSLVCVEDYPVGWGKVTGSRLKNKLKKGWLI